MAATAAGVRRAPFAKAAGTLRVPPAFLHIAISHLWRTACGAYLLLCLAAAAAAQTAAQDSALDNPFSDRSAAQYQTPDAPSLPLQPMQPAEPTPMGTAIPAEASVPQPYEPPTFADLLFGDNRKTPDDNRSGTFQKLSFVNTYLPRWGADGFGVYDVELTSVWGVPFPTTNAPLIITPGIATHWLDGPDGLDIPPQLHDAYTEFRWLPKIGERFRADLAVQPGYFSDWNGSSARAVRIMGHGSGIYDWSPTFQLVLGCAYLDRPDIELLPIAGFIWKPNEDAEYRLVFPAPRISWRLGSGRFATYVDPKVRDFDTWLYLGGELGGGTWAIRHTDGSSDLMSYSDIRVFIGLENRFINGLPSSNIEIGYVFHRYIRLTSTDVNFDVGDTIMARAGLSY